MATPEDYYTIPSKVSVGESATSNQGFWPLSLIVKDKSGILLPREYPRKYPPNCVDLIVLDSQRYLAYP